MITTSKVKEILEATDVQVSSVKKYGEEYPYWEVRLEPQCLGNYEIEVISQELNKALINFNYTGSSLVMNIHPYYKNY